MPKGIPGSRSPHGTITRYFTQGCRCEQCRTTAREYQRRLKGHQSRADYLASLPPLEHGTQSKYTAGCRCDDCRKASAAARRAHRQANPEAARAYDRERYRRMRLKTESQVVSIYCGDRRTLAIQRGDGWVCWPCGHPVKVAT